MSRVHGDAAASFLRAASIDDFEPGVPLAITLSDGRRICLVQQGDDVFAMEDRCSHRDFAISGGDLVAPCVLECPWHGARFDVRTGAALTGPAEETIPTFPVRIIEGVVFVGPLVV
jgi:3-phenylpropionate/trans-cinnamate dioxygenase ferredoxin subunit